MPDWKEEIRKRLPNLNLEPTREAEIVEELSQHLEDTYQELLFDGQAEAVARQVALAELSESDLLRRELRQATRTVNPQSAILGESKGENVFAGLWKKFAFSG